MTRSISSAARARSAVARHAGRRRPLRSGTVAVAAMLTLALCSCHGGGQGNFAQSSGAMPPGAMAAGGPMFPSLALSGLAPAPLPQMLVTPWAPPGIARPWPTDEYLHDGGDKEIPVTVAPSGAVNGLELEDTVVHCDTLDGRTLVEPSNRVNIYAPRFAAVRSVEETRLSRQLDGVKLSHLPVGPQTELERVPPVTAMLPVQPVGEVGVKQPSLAHLKQGEGILLTRDIPYSSQSQFKAFEDFEAIRLGTFNEEEKPRLAESIDAAIVWTADQAVQVVIEGRQALEEVSDQRAQQTFRVDLPTNPRLRVIKVASTNQARPGDLVDFTIRYDNVGDAPIGNVTLIDNLTTRLEYVDGTAKSGRDAKFFAEPNQGDSLVLRWEFIEPLDPGQGGLVRFQCRVR